MERSRADESVAVRFTRVMNATPSPWGVWSDVTFGAIVSGIILVIGLAVVGGRDRSSSLLAAALAFACVPPIVSIVVSVGLRGSRRRVVAWLASLPFEVVNMNALLAGLGDTIEVIFRGGSTPLPARTELQPKLEAVSEDVLMIRERAEERLIEIKLGVVDSKRNPLRTNHERYRRLQAVTERVLVPLHGRLAIERVQVV
jgi:hypothetical protein